MFGAISYDPIVNIELGPFNVSPHGIGIAVGFLLGARLMLPAAERRGISADDVYTLLTRAAVGSIIGARVAYFINHFGEYDSILDVFAVWEGGISLLGGFAGAIIAALPAMRSKGLSFWKVMDAAAPGMALGVIIGRVGDVIVGDHFGKRIDGDFFLGYECPATGTASPCGAAEFPNVAGAVVHQPHVYDLILTTVLLVVLLRLRRTPRYDGFLILVFGAAYGFNRFVEDWFRVDETHGTGLTGSQWAAVAAMLACGYVLAFRRATPAWGRWDERPPTDEVPPPYTGDAPPPDTDGAPAPDTDTADERPEAGSDAAPGAEPVAEGPTMTIPAQDHDREE